MFDLFLFRPNQRTLERREPPPFCLRASSVQTAATCDEGKIIRERSSGSHLALGSKCTMRDSGSVLKFHSEVSSQSCACRLYTLRKRCGRSWPSMQVIQLRFAFRSESRGLYQRTTAIFAYADCIAHWSHRRQQVLVGEWVSDHRENGFASWGRGSCQSRPSGLHKKTLFFTTRYWLQKHNRILRMWTTVQDFPPLGLQPRWRSCEQWEC